MLDYGVACWCRGVVVRRIKSMAASVRVGWGSVGTGGSCILDLTWMGSGKGRNEVVGCGNR